MSYVPHTVWVGAKTPVLVPHPIKSKYLNGNAGYLKYANSPVAQRFMARICARPGMSVAEIATETNNKAAYGYIDCLRRDGYIRVTTERKSNNVPIMRAWPTDLFLAKFPRNL